MRPELGPLLLSVKRSQWRTENGAESKEPAYLALRATILKRDAEACQYCGFSAPGSMSVRPLNGDFTDLSENNLITACGLCNLAFHIGYAYQTPGEEKPLLPGALMVLMTGVPQAVLNHVVRTAMVALNSANVTQRDKGNRVMSWLLERATPVEQVWRTSAPNWFAAALRDIDVYAYQARAAPLADLGLLVLPKRLAGQVEQWRTTIYSRYPDESWEAVASQTTEKITSILQKIEEDLKTREPE